MIRILKSHNVSNFDYYSDLDSHPFTGERKVDFKAKMKYGKVKNTTQGKVYDIYKVEGFGDVANFYFINDVGKEDHLCDYFFEKVS